MFNRLFIYFEKKLHTLFYKISRYKNKLSFQIKNITEDGGFHILLHGRPQGLYYVENSGVMGRNAFLSFVLL